MQRWCSNPARQHTSPHLHHAPTASAPAEMQPTNLGLPSSTRRPSGCPPAPSALPAALPQTAPHLHHAHKARLRPALAVKLVKLGVLQGLWGSVLRKVHQNQDAFIHSFSEMPTCTFLKPRNSLLGSSPLWRGQTGPTEARQQQHSSAHLAQLDHAVGAEVEDDHGIACRECGSMPAITLRCC